MPVHSQVTIFGSHFAFCVLRAVGVDRRVGAVGQPGYMPKAMLAADVHLAHRGMEHVGHALAAVFGIAVEPGPAALAQEVEGMTEALGRAHHAVFQHAALAVADGVERRQHVAGDLAGLLEDRRGEVRVELGIAGDVLLVNLQDVVQHEAHVPERRV